jgi:hypothetical protein
VIMCFLHAFISTLKCMYSSLSSKSGVILLLIRILCKLIPVVCHVASYFQLFLSAVLSVRSINKKGVSCRCLNYVLVIGTYTSGSYYVLT